jgi:hypothetical protein
MPPWHYRMGIADAIHAIWTEERDKKYCTYGGCGL